MAAAALDILGLLDEVAEYLTPQKFVPSPGQGCVAVECRVDDSEMIDLIAVIDHARSRHAVEVERAFLAELGSGCSLPVGAHSVNRTLTAFLADGDAVRSDIDTIELGDDHRLALARSADLARAMHARLS